MTGGHRINEIEAQSEVMGIVILLGVTFTAVAVVLAMGMPVLDDARENAQVERVQSEFATLDQQIRESAYTPSDAGTTVGLSEGGVEINSGSVVVTVEHNGDEAEMELGGLEYEESDSSVAYQMGGVWATYRDGGYSMQTPPDISYSGQSLSMNMINFSTDLEVRGDGRDFTFSSDGTYRDDDLEEITEGPLEAGTLSIELETEHDDAWEEYMNRTFGEDNVDGSPADSVEVELNTGPPLYGLENLDDVDTSNNPVNVTDSRTGADVIYNYTESELDSLPDGNVYDVADQCYANFEGDDLGDQDPVVTSGSYSGDDDDFGDIETFDAESGALRVHVDDDVRIDDSVNFSTSAGDVEVHVDGSLEINGQVSVDGDNSVRFYVNDDATGSVAVRGNADIRIHDDRPERFQVFTRGGVDSPGGIQSDYNGTLYAQDTIDMRNNVLRGAAITEDLEMGTNARYYHDTSLRSVAPNCANDLPLRSFDAVEHRVDVR